MDTQHVPVPGRTRWTDAFLDRLRTEGDPEADEALRLILRDDEANAVRTLFARMDSNDEVPLVSHFPVLSGFFESADRILSDVDLSRVHRGEDVFEAHAYAGALTLLTKSLPEGYQAPNLATILNISGDLRTYTYRRLLGTLQTVVNVSTCHGFEKGGRAVITARKLRMLHAGVRHLVPRYRPGYEKQYGVPINLEDMLGTIMGFSLLVIEGWRTLGARLTPEQEEDFLYLWCTFGRMMGIHPPGQPESTAYLPDNVPDAMSLYRQYERRHYVSGDANPDGLALAAANLAMLEKLIPGFFRLFGFGTLPRLFMKELMGAEACRRLDIPLVPGHSFLLRAFGILHRLFTVFSPHSPPDHERLAMILFQDLINRSYGGSITYTVPRDLQEMRSMVNRNFNPPQERKADA